MCDLDIILVVCLELFGNDSVVVECCECLCGDLV